MGILEQTCLLKGVLQMQDSSGNAGEKLIDHLKKWLEPDKLMAPPKMWENSQDSEIAVAILELFHLLPSAAAKFLETQQVRLPHLRSRQPEIWDHYH